MTQTASAVLRTLAALSPVAEQHSTGRTVPLDWFRWLPASAVRVLEHDQSAWPEPRSTESALKTRVDLNQQPFRERADSIFQSGSVDGGNLRHVDD